MNAQSCVCTLTHTHTYTLEIESAGTDSNLVASIHDVTYLSATPPGTEQEPLGSCSPGKACGDSMKFSVLSWRTPGLSIVWVPTYRVFILLCMGVLGLVAGKPNTNLTSRRMHINSLYFTPATRQHRDCRRLP